MCDGYSFNRKQFERVQRMDYISMGFWVEEVYQSGYSNGVKDAGGLTKKELSEVLLGIKGFDTKKAKIVAEAIELALAKKRRKK